MPRWVRVVALVLFAAAGASAQYDRPGVPGYRTDVKYDGRFTFVRVAWKTGSLYSGGWNAAWNHDYPRAEQHLSQILKELTYLDIRLDGSRILTLDDPDLFKYPIAFMWEPGFWTMSEVEARAFARIC